MIAFSGCPATPPELVTKSPFEPSAFRRYTYRSMSLAPKLSRRTATPPAVLVQKLGATVTLSVKTSQASAPAFEGGDFGPVAPKHLAPRSPPVYVPPANVAPCQLIAVVVLLTDPLGGVAARLAGERVARSARTMVTTT